VKKVLNNFFVKNDSDNFNQSVSSIFLHINYRTQNGGFGSFASFVRDERFDVLNAGLESFQLHNLLIGDHVRFGVGPFGAWQNSVFVGVKQQVEREHSFEEGQKSDGGGDLANHVPNLVLNVTSVNGHLTLFCHASVAFDLEVPLFDRLFRVDVHNLHHQLVDVTTQQKDSHLIQNYVKILFQFIIVGHQHRQTVLLDLFKRVGRVNAALIQDAVDGEICLKSIDRCMSDSK
jgi:hypothetical protein